MNNRIFLSPPHMSGDELSFVQEAFNSNYIAPLGPQVDAFEREFAEYCGIKYCVALSSATAALHLAMRCLGVGPGDEVIASTLTFIGSVTPIIFQGAKPVFVDSERKTWNMNPKLLRVAIEDCKSRGRLPKAVVPTDLYGQCSDLDRILEICEPFKIPVIVDGAESLGALYHKSETIDQKSEGTRSHKEKGDFAPISSTSSLWYHAGKGAKGAVFSFNGNKIITTSCGGILASDDKELIDHARKLSQQAREDFPHYEHREIGYNYRMSNILAAIGRGQLKVLNTRVKRKREIFNYYHRELGDLPGIEFMPEAPYGQSNRWLTVILITPEEFGMDCESIRLALEAENIEARPVWKPMHLQPVFNCSDQVSEAGYRSLKDKFEMEMIGGKVAPQLVTLIRRASVRCVSLFNSKFLWAKPRSTTMRFPPSKGREEQGKLRHNIQESYPARVIGGKVAESLFKRGLCLPSGTQMTQEDLDRVVKVFRKCKR